MPTASRVHEETSGKKWMVLAVWAVAEKRENSSKGCGREERENRIG